MQWFFLWLMLAVGTQLWLCFRVARSSTGFAIATFFFGAIGAAYTAFTEHGEEETSVTVPFVANIVFSALLFFSGWQMLVSLMDEEAMPDEQAMVSEDAAPRRDATVLLQEEAPQAVPAPQAAAPAAVDPVDAFSAGLRAVGVAHTVTRLPDNRQLPVGVADMAQVAAVASTQGSAEGTGTQVVVGQEVVATLLRCEAERVCRDLAGAYMHKAAKVRPRVLQNGRLLLLIPGAATGEFDMSSASMVSVFKSLRP